MTMDDIEAMNRGYGRSGGKQSMTNTDEQILHPRGALRQLRNPAQ
jgi:hypothetical protein